MGGTAVKVYIVGGFFGLSSGLATGTGTLHGGRAGPMVISRSHQVYGSCDGNLD